MGRTICCLILGLASAPVAHARAAECSAAAHAVRDPEEASAGTVFFELSPETGWVAAAALATDIDMHIRGPLVRTSVRQTFWNPSDLWLEAIYVFPLPDLAAVDFLEIRVGERTIEGQIHEKASARRIYTTARDDGKIATLVEQSRPNVFKTSVANIAPGEEIEVTIGYSQTVEWNDGAMKVGVPLVVMPRYETSTLEGMPPPAEPGVPWIGNPVAIRVDLDAGFPLAFLQSPTHTPDYVRVASGRWEILLDDVPADRDFALVWTPERGEAPDAAVFAEDVDGDVYVVATILPPAAPRFDRQPTRETVFVIDTSGSMGGPSIRQARRALLLALERLGPNDFFNVIEFNNAHTSLFERSQRVRPDRLGSARAFVSGLDAGGGTNMGGALRAALVDPGEGDVRQVVFLTDGAVANESELFAIITRELGRSRLFPIGIGSAPNAYFMSRAARFGRGTYTPIASSHEVETRVGELFAKLERPVLHDVEIDWPDGGEMWPARVPDLYAGEPIVVAARLPRDSAEVSLRGFIGNDRWEARLALEPDRGAGLDTLWARRKIAAQMETLAFGANRADVRRDVVAIALQHHLVSQFTSLVAVDVTPTRPEHGLGMTAWVPLMREHGGGGVLPRGATGASLRIWLGLGCVGLALAGLGGRLRGTA